MAKYIKVSDLVKFINSPQTNKMPIAGIRLPRISLFNALRACRKINIVTCLGGIEKKCIHCTVKGEAKHYCYCDMWNSVVEPDGFCNYGEQEK